MAISARNGPRRPAASLSSPELEIGGLAESIGAGFARQRAAAGIFGQPGPGVGAAAQIEAGAIELTVRDLGSVDVGVVQYARAQNVSRDVARRAIVDKSWPAARTQHRQP